MQILNFFLLLSILSFSLIGCSSLNSLTDAISGRKVDYKKQSRSIERLEMPPDLIAAPMNDIMPTPQLASENGQIVVQGERGSTQQQGFVLGEQVLPPQKGIKVLWEGNSRVLLINGSKRQVWDKVRDFWLNKGMLIKRETAAIGILETEWAENRADIPQDMIRSALGNVFESMYSAGTRDKYRIRLEEEYDAPVVRLYITHYGLKEVVENSSAERVVWETRPRDPELEVEMLNQMMVYFGMEAKKSKALLAQQAQNNVDRANLVSNTRGDTRLLIKETFPRAWRSVGVALDRMNFVVDDKVRSDGMYFVTYADPFVDKNSKSWLSRLKFWEKDSNKESKRYIIQLEKSTDNTLVLVLDEKKVVDNSSTAERILNLLHEELK